MQQFPNMPDFGMHPNIGMQSSQNRMMQPNQPNLGTQQRIMTQPPDLMTSKDMLYTKDMLAWNLLGMKKAHFLAQQCQDQEIRQALEEAGMMHQRHYQQLLNHLQMHQNQSTMQ